MTKQPTSTRKSPFHGDSFDIFLPEHRALIADVLQTIQDETDKALQPLRDHVAEFGGLPCKMALVVDNDIDATEFLLELRMRDGEGNPELGRALQTYEQLTSAIDLSELAKQCSGARELFLPHYPFDDDDAEQKDHWADKFIENQLLGWADYYKNLLVVQLTELALYVEKLQAGNTKPPKHEWVFRFIVEDEDDEGWDVVVVKPVLVIEDTKIATYVKLTYG